MALSQSKRLPSALVFLQSYQCRLGATVEHLCGLRWKSSRTFCLPFSHATLPKLSLLTNTHILKKKRPPPCHPSTRARVRPLLSGNRFFPFPGLSCKEASCMRRCLWLHPSSPPTTQPTKLPLMPPTFRRIFLPPFPAIPPACKPAALPCPAPPVSVTPLFSDPLYPSAPPSAAICCPAPAPFPVPQRMHARTSLFLIALMAPYTCIFVRVQ